MLQDVLVWIVFAAAVGWLVYRYWPRSQKSAGCSGGCTACSSIDFDKIEADIQKNKVLS